MREPTIGEIRSAAATGEGDLRTVREANAYLRIRFGWACNERDAAAGQRNALAKALAALRCRSCGYLIGEKRPGDDLCDCTDARAALSRARGEKES